MSQRCKLILLATLALLFSAAPQLGVCQTSDELQGKQIDSGNNLFRENIAPILVTRCLVCHGVKQEGGYSVATAEKLFMAGDSQSRPIVSKQLDQSEIWLRLISEDKSQRMPLDAAPLPKEQLDVIRKWIEDGAQVDTADGQRSLSALASARTALAPEHYARPIAINTLAIAADATSIWVGGYAEVTNWRIETGELITRVPVAGLHVAAIALPPDRKSILVSSGSPGQRGVVERIGLHEKFGTRAALDATSDIAADLAVKKDGLQAVIAGQDGSLRVVELPSDLRFGETVSITPHADTVLALAWSADGKRFVSASRDRTAKLFDAATLNLIASYDRHERAVGGAGFLGKRPLSLDETGKLRMMAGDDGDNVVAEQSGLPRVLQRFVVDGEWVFIADRNRLREFRIESKIVDDGKDDEGKPKTKTVTKFREGDALTAGSGEWITSVGVAESAIAVGTQQGSITVWDRSTKQLLNSFLAKP